jgi:chromosome segregation ATPase
LLQVKESLLKQNGTLQSELATLKERVDFEEQKMSENSENIDVGTECLIPVHLYKGIQTEPCSDFQENDEMYAKCRRNLEMDIQEKILKLVTFEIPRDYYNFKNNKDDITPMGTVEALVKMCVECKWQRDTLERKVAELMKELRDAKHMCEERSKAARELDCECRALKGNVETLIEELMVSKSGGGEALAPILENSEEAEAMEQKIVMLENEVEVLREARSNLEVDGKALREEGQTLVTKLQAANAMLRNQENLEAEISRWQGAATSAYGQLKEALAAKCCLEEEVEMLRRQLLKVEAMTQHQVSSNQKTVGKLEEEVAQLQERLLDQEDLRSQKEGLLNMVTYTQDQLHLSNLDRSKLKDEIEELQKHIEDQGHLQTEVASLQKQLLEAQHAKEQLTVKTRELENALLRISEYERHSQDLHEDLKNCKEDWEALKVKLNEKEAQINDEMNSKLLIQKELSHIQEELSLKLEEISEFKAEKTLIEQNLIHIVQEKSDAESKYEGLLSELHSRDVEIQNLTTMKLQLEQEVERLHSPIVQAEYQAAATEVNRWKEMAEAYERQLSEAFKVRDELEQECRRLYLIETRLQSQEHLDQEVEHWKKLLVEMEQNSNQLLTDKLSLEKQCADIKEQLHNIEEMEKEAKERAATTEQQLRGVLNDKTELETKIQMLHAVEEKFKNLEKEFIRKEELNFSLQKELSEVTLAKCGQEAECKRLLAVEGKLRNQESLEQELKGLRQRLAGAEKELNEAMVAKSQLEDDYKKTEITRTLLKSEVITQKSKSGVPEECEIWNNQEGLKMKQEIKVLQSEQQKLLSVLDNKTQENDILKADNIRLLQVIAEQTSGTTRCEGECQFQCHELSKMAKETVANLSKIIKDKDMEIEALNQNLGTRLLRCETHPRNEEFLKFKEEVSGQLRRLNDEKTELLRTVQVKHEENIKYNSEIQRLTGLLQQEMNKLAEIKFQHANLAQQNEEKQNLMLSMQNDLATALLRIQQLEMGHTKLASCSDSGEDGNANNTQKVSELVQRHAQEQQAMEKTIHLLHSQVKDLRDQILLLSEQKHTEPVPHTQNKVSCEVRL